MQRERHLAVWLRMLAQMEIRASRGSKNILKSQGKRIENAYTSGGQTAVEEVIKNGQSDWVKYLVATYATVIKEFVAYTNDQLGLKPKKASFIDIVQGFIARNAYKKSEYVTDSSHKIVKKIINEGISSGLGEKEIAKNLKSQFTTAASDSRARMIARTEVHDAATYGMQSAAEESGADLIREWVAVEDQRTRQAHADVDGETAEMDEPFDVGGEEIMRPGEGSEENSINCRCTLIYVPREFTIEGDNSGDFI